MLNTKVWALAFAATLAAGFAAQAGGVSPAVDRLVNDCAYHAGVRTTYQITPIAYGKVAAYSVPPGGGVTAAQSRKINACIAQGVRGTPTAAKRTKPARASGTAGCLAEYKHKMRTTRDGLDYRGTNVGTQVFSGLFGSGMGRQLIEHEYDRCMNRVEYAQNRCPTGVFENGAGYCIKRPYR